MKNILKNKNEFDSSNLILFLWKWRKAFIIIILVAAIASALASYMITSKYKATVVIMPTLTNSISKSVIAQMNGNERDIMEFGDEDRAEQLLQILSSANVRDRVIKNYDLLKEWKINKEDKKWLSYAIYEYSEMISFRRTEFMAVEIKVMAKDPVKAAEIANGIPKVLDSVKLEIQRQRALESVKIVENECNLYRNNLKVLMDSLQVLNTLGINDLASQSERYHQQLIKEVASGNTRGIRAVQGKIDILSKYGTVFVDLNESVNNMRLKLLDAERKLDELKIDAESYIPQKFVVEEAPVNFKKAYPIRWLIVAVSTISAFIFGVVILLVFETISQATSVNKEENLA
jgi:uncharacterized protein involved in exopolysaccharide biosynthesis